MSKVSWLQGEKLSRATEKPGLHVAPAGGNADNPARLILEDTFFHLLCESAWAAIAKHHSLGRCSNRNSFLTVVEAGKPEIKSLVHSVLGKGSLLACR